MQRLEPARLLDPVPAEVASRLEIPDDLVRQSRHRVRLAAAMGTGVYGVFLASQPFRLAGAASTERLGSLANDLVGLTVCAGLFLASLFRGIGDRAVLHLALACEVLLAALISIAMPTASFLRTGDIPSLTWTVPMIILVPVLVAASPSRTIPAAVLCGLTMPLGLWVLDARGIVAAQPADYWGSVVAGGVAVGIASIATHAMYSAGRQVAAARMVGSYELIERLGQGGMGEVWKARHRLLARPAAVKFIRPERLGGAENHEAAIQRFWREARWTASLRSPHTVELFDFGASTEGALYYAMELLDGMNLEHFVYQFGAVEPRRAVHWLRQACHSLGEAHALSLIHRDLKPANLFVCRAGRDEDVVKVLDFGLAKPTVAVEDAALTTPGVRMGTPGCMAPELVFGQEAGPRTDLYALGCVGYWLLAGRKPFEADSAAELLRRHVHDPPPPFSSLAGQAVPARLEQALLSCLSKDPAARPADADQLSALLEESLDGQVWTQADARAWWATRPENPERDHTS